MAGPSPYASGLSLAVTDLGAQTLRQRDEELDAMKKKKQAMGAKAQAIPMGSAAVMSLTGNQY